jgi:hypothetical protein
MDAPAALETRYIGHQSNAEPKTASSDEEYF